MQPDRRHRACAGFNPALNFVFNPYNAALNPAGHPHTMNDRSPESVIDRIRSAIGAQAVLTAATDIEPYIVDWRGVYRGAAAAVVRPANTA